MIFLSSVSFLSLVSSLKLLGLNYCYFLDWEVLTLNGRGLEMALIFDWMSLIFISFVCFISSIVLYYSGGYMGGDGNIIRFMYLVLCFVFSILLLIVRPNMIRILLGWDGLGLVSYALVIYYNNEKSASAGMLTALSNRVGDVAILLRIALMSGLGGWNYIFYVNGALGVSLVVGFVVLAAMTKRAQIPFSAWLPAAIAAPTPVSALVHSSTLVTAGVYLIIRFRPVICGSEWGKYLLLLSCLTMFIAGLGANFEYDLKKIIALSTLSQLGVIIRILSLGYSRLAFFHLLTHALFKALLFMCAGSVIHNVGDSQDIRSIGGLVRFMPLRVMMINLANLSLCGFPFIAGFYSKDLILEVAFSSVLSEVCFWLYVVSTGLTVCYTFRLIYYSLRGDYNLGCQGSIGDEDVLITTPMFGLCVGAICSGSFLSWLIFPCPLIVCLPLVVKFIPLMVVILGAFVGYSLNMISVRVNLKSLVFYSSVRFAGSMWFLPFLSTIAVSEKLVKGGSSVYFSGDFGWLEYYGGQGGYRTISRLSISLQIIQENSIKVYMVILFVWVLGALLIV